MDQNSYFQLLFLFLVCCYCKFKVLFLMRYSNCKGLWKWGDKLHNSYACTAGAFWFWNSAVVEPCNWKHMANMYGTNCLSEDFASHHTLVLREVQTLDCCMIYFSVSNVWLPWYSIGFLNVLYLISMFKRLMY